MQSSDSKRTCARRHVISGQFCRCPEMCPRSEPLLFKIPHDLGLERKVRETSKLPRRLQKISQII